MPTPKSWDNATVHNLPTLYLLSGNGSQASWWQDTLSHFQHHTPKALELPGFGDNPSNDYESLAQLADALVAMTRPDQKIFAVGINALVVLHALVRHPGHFQQSILLAPVGAFLWQRRFVKLMSFKPICFVIHFLLARFPRLFAKKFSSNKLPDYMYDRIGEGYAKCRAFRTLFDIVKPWNALDHFEWIDDKIDIIWGTKDAVLDAKQAAAWDSILPRATLTIRLREDWGHYPYWDNAQGFAQALEALAQALAPTLPAHSKAGRLQLATLAGLHVPQHFAIADQDDATKMMPLLSHDISYAIRSSGVNEDHIDSSMAGINDTKLRVPKTDVQPIVQAYLANGMHRIVVQEFVEPKVSGVAFCRWLSLEVEYVAGHLECVVDGTAQPKRCIFSKMKGSWSRDPEPLDEAPNFPFDQLEAFLRNVIKTFHYAHSDIVWAWDGERFHLFQIRPVTAYGWRRSLTSANLDEILPPQVSRIMEHAQRRASLTIPRVYAMWDARTLNDNEPFTATYEDASYINSDVFLSRFHDWGLPGRLMAKEIGGAVPAVPFRPLRLLKSIPRMLKMQWICRRQMLQSEHKLLAYERELDAIAQRSAGASQIAAAVRWFCRYYTFIVQQNMVINAALSSTIGSFLGKQSTVYRDLSRSSAPHRLKFESDPATERAPCDIEPITPLPRFNGLQLLFHYFCLPGLSGKYFEVREWFRDNNMKLFFRLHHVLKGSEWCKPHRSQRSQAGSFWQNGEKETVQSFSFVIYPGQAKGTVGDNILIVDALEPGHLEDYMAADAVISRTGGRLSHGATLLREIQKPSAVMAELPPLEQGTQIQYRNGQVTHL